MAVKRVYKRLAILFAVLVMSAGLCIGLAACGGASEEDQQMITAELDKAFGMLKNPNQDTVKALVGDDASKLDEFAQYGIDPVEMLKHTFGHLDYKVDGIKAEGDKATVKVTLNNVDFQAVASQFASDMQNDEALRAQATAALVSGDEQGAYKVIFDKLYSALDESDKLVASTAEFQMEKENGQWSFTEEGNQELAAVVLDTIDLSPLV